MNLPDVFLQNLDKVNWRVNIVITSRDLSRVMEPVVFLEFVEKTGRRHGVEVPLPVFQSLRRNVALMCKEMDSVNRRGSNIVRIISDR